jgi:hypothetical protein
MVAAMPFLFGVQQAAEGIVWQTMGKQTASSLHQFGIITFLTFALVVWPSWLPWSVYQIESDETRKSILKKMGWVGLFVSLLAASVLLGFEIEAYVIGHSLGYAFFNLNRDWPANIEFFLYFIPTMLPFFISSIQEVKKAGYLVFGSMVVSLLINQATATSVWCFFAALISLFISGNILWRQHCQAVRC